MGREKKMLLVTGKTHKNLFFGKRQMCDDLRKLNYNLRAQATLRIYQKKNNSWKAFVVLL
jgi:hypothetical protein